nr:hypothetical protein [Myxococcus fulvus]
MSDGQACALKLVGRRRVEGRVENPSARRVAEVTLDDVARALEASHAAGVVHRDVKDANVMVRGADGLAVLEDYGLGDFRGAPGVTQSLLPPGTLEYRPPGGLALLEAAPGAAVERALRVRSVGRPVGAGDRPLSTPHGEVALRLGERRGVRRGRHGQVARAPASRQPLRPGAVGRAVHAAVGEGAFRAIRRERGVCGLGGVPVRSGR